MVKKNNIILYISIILPLLIITQAIATVPTGPFTYSDSPCKVAYVKYGSTSTYWTKTSLNLNSSTGQITVHPEINYYDTEHPKFYVMAAVSYYWNGTGWAGAGQITDEVVIQQSTEFEISASPFTPPTEPCNPEPCQPEYQAALQQCGGDPEKLEIISMEEGNCDIRCEPCKLEPDQLISYSPEGWSGVTESELQSHCGGPQFVESYNAATCTGYCQPKCEQQYMDLVSYCGGEQNILSFDNNTCTGKCLDCRKEHEQATAECGQNRYTMDANCNYECQNCDELYNECVAKCGGLQKIVSFQCSDSDKSASNCICSDAPIVPDPQEPNPDPEAPPDNTSTTVTKNPDGSWTTVTEQGKQNPDGTVTITTTTTNYDSNGNQTSSSTSTTTKPGPGQPKGGDVDEEEEEEEEEEYETPGQVGTASCPAGEICSGDGTCQPGEEEYSKDCAGEDYVENRFLEMQGNIKNNGIFNLVNNMNIPSGGTAMKTVAMGSFGETTVDYSKFDNIWEILKYVLLFAAGFLSIKIITLKGGD